MAVVETWIPPSREHWELITFWWQFFPVITIIQSLLNFYPQGKTSIDSRFNIPGKIGWTTMEAPGFILLLYIMFSLPQQHGIEKLPGANWLMASLFLIESNFKSFHYVYRAILAPLALNPSMSPIHPLVWFFALSFQITNATCIGGWLAAYGPVTNKAWEGRVLWIELGMIMFGVGLLGNFYHDDELREIRRAAARKQERREKARSEKGPNKNVDKVYMVPENGLFKLILFPHYLCEWIEWCGFWMIGGLGCVPARAFVVNEVFTMTVRAIQGWHWYVERFGKEKIGNRRAVIPGIL